MSSRIQFQTIADALKNASIADSTVKADGPVVVDGSLIIDTGDAILIKGEQCIELDAFTLFLTLGMTSEGDLFGGMRCVAPQNIIYISGRSNRDKFLKNLSVIDKRYDKSRFRLITNDQLHHNHRLKLGIDVHQENILQGLKSMNGLAGVIVFDNASSLIISDSKVIDKELIRGFVQRMMEMGVIQVWMCTNTKSTDPLPEDLFDFVFRVEPDKKSDTTSFSVQCERNAYLDQEKFPPMRLELARDEGGMLNLVDRGLLINDRLVAISYAVKGKTQKEIGEFLGKDQSTISLWLSKATAEGLIRRNGNNYDLTFKGRKALTPLNDG